MKRFAIILMISLLLLLSCESVDNKPIFNGVIHVTIDSIDNKYIHIIGELFDLDSINDGSMHVYDSLLIFTSKKYRNDYIQVFNAETGKHVGALASIGVGPDEFTHLSIYDQFVVDDNNISVWVSDVIYGYRLLNLTESLKLGKIQVDSTIHIRNIWFGENYSSQPWAYSEILSDGRIFARSLPHVAKNEYDKVVAVDYGNYNFILAEDPKKSKIFTPFNQTPKFSKNFIPIELFDTWIRFKPDHTKVAALLSYIPQLNILDVNSMSQAGYCIEELSNINNLNYINDILKEEPRVIYMNITVTDKYIIGLYGGDDNDLYESKLKFSPESDKLHIFDWEGNLCFKLNLDHKVSQIALNPTNNILYTMNNLDEVYKYNIANLLN